MTKCLETISFRICYMRIVRESWRPRSCLAPHRPSGHTSSKIANHPAGSCRTNCRTSGPRFARDFAYVLRFKILDKYTRLFMNGTKKKSVCIRTSSYDTIRIERQVIRRVRSENDHKDERRACYAQASSPLLIFGCSSTKVSLTPPRFGKRLFRRLDASKLA
jgi:hypothetical protein